MEEVGERALSDRGSWDFLPGSFDSSDIAAHRDSRGHDPADSENMLQYLFS